MKTQAFLLLLLFALISCSTPVPEDNPNMNPAPKITQEEYDNLPRPCLDDPNIISIPTKLELEENYSQHDYTTSLVLGIKGIREHLESLLLVIGAPIDAIVEGKDNIHVYEGEKAYSWIDGDDKYLLVLRDFGYQIYFFDDINEVSGDEMIYLNQDDECTDFEYIEYPTRENVNANGEVIHIGYDKAGTADILTVATETYLAGSKSETFRDFNDDSGDYYQYIDGVVSLYLSWEANGSGNYRKYVDGEVVEEGLWAF